MKAAKILLLLLCLNVISFGVVRKFSVFYIPAFVVVISNDIQLNVLLLIWGWFIFHADC